MKMSHLHIQFLVFVMTMTGISLQSVQAEESLNIVVFGASGRVGEVIVMEALERGHKVTGISRSPETLQFNHPNFTAAFGDMLEVNSIVELARGADAIVISISAKASDNIPEHSLIVPVTKNVEEALNTLETKPYLLQIGSANLMYGSSFEEIKANMKDAPFPFEEGTVMHAVLFGHQLSLEMYQASKLAWTILAPPMKIHGIYKIPDSTTTKATYRTSTSGPIIADDGSKSIYVRDLAKAAVNEIEEKKFVGQVFTVGY
ncbi:MAG: putative NADH-flavin reductase [Planctomycetota bacterium]|jgi:putative NADH-flavin reductase